jgi:hypothetical protein
MSNCFLADNNGAPWAVHGDWLRHRHRHRSGPQLPADTTDARWGLLLATSGDFPWPPAGTFTWPRTSTCASQRPHVASVTPQTPNATPSRDSAPIVLFLRAVCEGSEPAAGRSACGTGRRPGRLAGSRRRCTPRRTGTRPHGSSTRDADGSDDARRMSAVIQEPHRPWRTCPSSVKGSSSRSSVSGSAPDTGTSPSDVWGAGCLCRARGDPRESRGGG